MFSCHVFEFNAEFWTVHTALPVYLLVPERVRTCIWAFPRPISASTGEMISRSSPTMSGFKTVAAWKPARVVAADALLLIPSRVTFTLPITFKPPIEVS